MPYLFDHVLIPLHPQLLNIYLNELKKERKKEEIWVEKKGENWSGKVIFKLQIFNVLPLSLNPIPLFHPQACTR